jgi:hypothetical protein
LDYLTEAGVAQVADNPSDAKEVAELDRQYNALKDKLDDARVAAGFVVTRARAGQPKVRLHALLLHLISPCHLLCLC